MSRYNEIVDLLQMYKSLHNAMVATIEKLNEELRAETNDECFVIKTFDPRLHIYTGLGMKLDKITKLADNELLTLDSTTDEGAELYHYTIGDVPCLSIVLPASKDTEDLSDDSM